MFRFSPSRFFHHQSKRTPKASQAPSIATPKKRLVILIDSDLVTVQTYFTKVEPYIKTINNHNNISVEHKLFFQQANLKQEWQQVVLNRMEHFEPFRVQRFIATHLQMIAVGANIAQSRFVTRHDENSNQKNRRKSSVVDGIVFVTDQVMAKPLFVEQIENKRKDSFALIDRFVVSGDGGFALKKIVGFVNFEEDN